MKTTFPVISLFILNSILFSQVTQEWVTFYNYSGNSLDIAKSIGVDNWGNVFVTGYSGTFNDYATLKYNSSGVQQWVQRYNGSGNNNDRGISLVVDDSGNVYVTGYSYEGSITFIDYSTIKYNSAGIQQWIQKYNGPISGNDEPRSIAIDKLGNVYVTGISDGMGSMLDYATIKYNSAGVLQWVQRFNGLENEDDEVYSIAIDSFSNVFVTGSCNNNGTDVYATIKYTSSGVQQWVRIYDVPGSYAQSISVDNTGNSYVTGYSYGSGSGFDYTTLKYNSSGVQQWVQRYNGLANGEDEAYALVLDNSDNVYVTGRSFVNGTYFDYTTIKYNSAGIQQWIQIYNGPGEGYDAAYSITTDSLGNIYLTGYSRGNGTGDDYATIKYNSSGVQQWVQRYNGPGNSHDAAYSIATDNSGNVYVTGYCYGFGTGYDYGTIKYSQSIGIQPTSSEIPKSYSLSQNYPNPFNPVTKIRFSIPLSRGVSADGGRGVLLQVYDILGREITVLVNEQLKPGTYEVEFDGSNYPSGVYFYTLNANEYKESKKMILLK